MINNILILEDQPEGLHMLKRVISSVIANANISHAPDLSSLSKFEPSQFDLFLVDLRLPDGLSCDYIERFKSCCPHVPAIVTTLYADDDLVFSALSAGADGYLLKGDGEDKLVRGLKRMLNGEPPISPAIARKLMRQFASPAQTTQTNKKTEDIHHILTPREVDVLTHIGKGMLVKQVAAELGISHHTVNDNIKSIYRKLGIKSRAEATLHASRSGLL